MSLDNTSNETSFIHLNMEAPSKILEHLSVFIPDLLFSFQSFNLGGFNNLIKACQLFLQGLNNVSTYGSIFEL